MRIVTIFIAMFFNLTSSIAVAQSLPTFVLEHKDNGECYQVRDYLTNNGLSLFQYRSCIASHRTKFIEQALQNLDCETIESLMVPDEGLSSLFECRANSASISGDFNSHWRSFSEQRRLRVSNMISREEYIERAELIHLKAQQTEDVELIEYSQLHFEEFTAATSRSLARIEEEGESLQTRVVQTTAPSNQEIRGVVNSGDGELNLRAGPSTDSEILEVLRNGQTVTLRERQGDWGQIEVCCATYPLEGWVYLPLVDFGENAIQEASDEWNNQRNQCPPATYDAYDCAVSFDSCGVFEEFQEMREYVGYTIDVPEFSPFRLIQLVCEANETEIRAFIGSPNQGVFQFTADEAGEDVRYTFDVSNTPYSISRGTRISTLRPSANSNDTGGFFSNVQISRADAETDALEWCQSYWLRGLVDHGYSHCVIDYCSEYDGSWSCEADPKR